MLGAEGKGWFDHSLPTADELKESIFQAHERADRIGVLSTIIETTTNLVACPTISQKVR